MNTLFEILPLLIPILLIDIALAVGAVRHILRHPCYRFGNKTMWLVIAIVLLLFGPLIYFAFGKGEME
ncbi:PLD nuclease N-terminal domain-containing protein [Blautia hydrogenotrophica]|uniref:PLD nuclease N-terminal domain-containing protein n=1 Tax=Blautia hydrogenotrophica TaxID=53443 RepID=UPI002E7A142B|nr:PLD nuclease N-terminal domain-containing protein [Blautia hydrogenotrophica]MEE0462614.1 PLD nuclease N-terminal domain-containing protein [Blautia hydrogenotrophica]